jgi:pimeloyl-ACP methyl ester carboxylesterase
MAFAGERYARMMPERPEITSFTSRGATIVVEGRGESGPGHPTFLLVHGIGMGRTVFASLREELAGAGRVIAIDLPGYGNAPEPDRTPTIERMADLVADYLHASAEGRVILIGHSMGTQIVAETVARHPGIAHAVVLIAPTVDPRARTAWGQFRRLVRDLLVESPKVIAIGAREYVRAGPHLRRKLRAMLAHRPEDAYPHVTVPALVLRGEQDVVAPRDWCLRVVAALPEGRYAEIPDHGHETMIRDASPAAREILRFVREEIAAR